MISLPGRETTRPSGGGFTLVELLVGASIAAVILAAAYAWLWNVAALADGADDRAQAGTLAAAVSRAVAADVHAGVCVVEPPAGRDPSRSLSIVHDHAAVAAEVVLIVWDPARGVVWRNASGTYIADHVSGFAVEYVLADGAAHRRRSYVRDRLGRRPSGARRSRDGRRLGDGPQVHRGEGRARMTPRRSSGGYAMLAALLVMTLAATFALVVVGAVHSLQVVEGADAAGWRAAAIEGEALAAATRSLRWRPSEVAGAVEEDDPGAREAWMVTWAPAPAVTGDVWPRIAVQVVTSSGRANHRDDLVLDLRSEPWAMGVTCSADADIAAPFTVSGSGIYVGGCLRGRENVSFVGVSGFVTPAGAPTDFVRGDDFPAAAVHGGAGIFARGIEIHDGSGQSEFADDTDRHWGVPIQEEWLAGPTRGVPARRWSGGDIPGAGAERRDPEAGRGHSRGRPCGRALPARSVGRRSHHRGLALARCWSAACRRAGRRRPGPAGRDARARPEGSSWADVLWSGGPWSSRARCTPEVSASRPP